MQIRYTIKHFRTRRARVRSTYVDCYDSVQSCEVVVSQLNRKVHPFIYSISNIK